MVRSLQVGYGNQLEWEQVEFHELSGQEVWYQLLGLKPRTGYEVRVSHPAIIPATFTIRLSQPGSSGKPARRLLDVDKVMFRTDTHALLQGHRPLVVLQARRRARHRDGQEAYPTHMVYNILCEEIVLGLPRDTLPMAAAVVLTVLGMWLAVPWWLRTAVPALLRVVAA